jgi:hypothetical protein
MILEGNKYQARLSIMIDLIQSKIVEEDLRTQYGEDKNARLRALTTKYMILDT